MTSLSEFALFKECVANPVTLDRSLSQLNLTFIKDPAGQPSSEPGSPRASTEPDSPEAAQRKAVRLFYMVWSGVTKCLRHMVQEQKKALEIANFGIFGPISETNQGRDPLDKGAANTQRAAALKLGICPVFVVVNDELLNQMNWEVSLDQTSEKAVGRFNKHDRTEVNDLFRNKIAPLSLSSIASVCMTDSATVDLVLKEIVAAISENARRGRALRLNFKVGHLVIQNQLVQWQHSRDLLRRAKVSQSIDQSSVLSGDAASERPTQALSVITPSVARYSRATSTDYRNFHMSNPNPQGSQQRFYGPRDTASNTGSPEKPGSRGSGQPDMVRFGKKINFASSKLTNEQLLQDHLREMRQHLIEKRNQRSMQIDEDRKYLARVADRDTQEQHMKMRSSEVLKNEFLFFNDQKTLENKLKREQERDESHKSKLDYFPFVSGELLEQHRQGLSGQMRADLQNYLIAKSQGLVGTDSRKFSTPNRSSARESVFKAISDGSVDTRSDRLTKASTSIVKALHDSCYQVPEKNPRVIQDTDPVKTQAWRAALERHETQVAQQKVFNEVVMKKHYEKVAGDDAQVAHEADDRKHKQKRFFEEIRSQIDTNAVRRGADHVEAKRLVPTSFGPSEDEDVVMKQRMIVDKQRRAQREDLSQQIEAKKQMRDLDRRTKIDAERSEIDENHAALRAADDRRAADRREAREFWQEQLQRNDQQRKLGKDADDVLKRPVAA